MCKLLKPEIIFFAGPNGSGKSTITDMIQLNCTYVNADEIKKALGCSDLEAATLATERRYRLLESGENFAFETVLSSNYNMELLYKAKEKGYFIRCFYILTNNPKINVSRVKTRVLDGGHDVPEDKIVNRYYKALAKIPELVDLCDIFHIYDNSEKPFRIFKKRKSQFFFWENYFWSKEDIFKLTGKTE